MQDLETEHAGQHIKGENLTFYFTEKQKQEICKMIWSSVYYSQNLHDKSKTLRSAVSTNVTTM